jgi:hypothetical protein
MADIAESGPDWSELSPSVQGAFEWAAAATVRTLRSKADDQPMVVASALLFGIIMSHRGSSEPEALLEHFGRTRDQLFEALQRQVQESEPAGAPFELDLNVQSPHTLDDLPWLSDSVEKILARSWDLAQSLDPAFDGLLHLPILFGGILEVEDTSAYRALIEVLSGAPIDKIHESYRKYLEEGRDRPPYTDRLNNLFPEATVDGSSDIAREGNLRGAANDTIFVADQLGFKDYVDAFAQLIASPDTYPPLTIGIYGSWGTGKSFLLHHIEDQLDPQLFDKNFEGTSRLPDSEPWRNVHVVHFNAWEYSAAEVIWPALVRRILDRLEKTVDQPQRFAERFWRNVRRQTRQFRGRLIVVALVVALVALAALWQSGSDATIIGGAIAVLGVAGVVKLVTDTLANPLGQYVTALAENSDYGKHIAYMTDIREDLEKLQKRLLRDESRILVVIDDLDRCEPEKAVEVLQAINLLLNFESFIVCIGIDARIVTAAIQKHYEDLLGEVKTSGYEYLEKIVQIPFRMPQPDVEQIKSFISSQMNDPKPSSEEGERDNRRREPGSAGDQSTDNQGTVQTDDAEGGTSSQTPQPPGPRPGVKLVPFKYDELQAFEKVAQFLRPNPRYLKRLVNIYRLVRSLADAKSEHAILDKPEATIRWLVMCIQWPHTSHAMLWQFGKMLEKWNWEIPAITPAGDPLLHLLDKVSPQLSTNKHHELDEESESLRELLEHGEEQLTWEELQRIRQYTVNFNPVIEGETWAPTAEHLSDSTGEDPADVAILKDQTKRYRRIK